MGRVQGEWTQQFNKAPRSSDSLHASTLTVWLHLQDGTKMSTDVTSAHDNIKWKKGNPLRDRQKEKKEKHFLEALQQIFPCVLLANGLGHIPVPERLTEDLKAMLNHKRHLTSG